MKRMIPLIRKAGLLGERRTRHERKTGKRFTFTVLPAALFPLGGLTVLAVLVFEITPCPQMQLLSNLLAEKGWGLPGKAPDMTGFDLTLALISGHFLWTRRLERLRSRAVQGMSKQGTSVKHCRFADCGRFSCYGYCLAAGAAPLRRSSLPQRKRCGPRRRSWAGTWIQGKRSPGQRTRFFMLSSSRSSRGFPSPVSWRREPDFYGERCRHVPSRQAAICPGGLEGGRDSGGDGARQIFRGGVGSNLVRA